MSASAGSKKSSRSSTPRTTTPKWQAPDASAPKTAATPTETGAPADPPVRGAAPDADDDGRGQRGAVG